MSEQTASALRAWFRRVEPIYPELFNTAHVICGNYDQAEYALRSAILEIWLQNAEGGIGFRERLRSAVRDEALRTLREDAGDFTWPGFPEDGEDVVSRLIGRESLEHQRVLMLRHGLGFSPGRISAITGLTTAQARSILSRFEARCRRKLPGRERNRADLKIAAAARRQLEDRTGIPHPATVYRAFQAEASNLQVSEHRLSRVIYKAVTLMMALICAALFWLFAVLVQPPELEPQPEPTPPGPTMMTAYLEDS